MLSHKSNMRKLGALARAQREGELHARDIIIPERAKADGRSYRDLAQARQAIDRFLEQVYNRQRLHSALAYHAPAEIEANPTLLLSVMKRSTAGSTATCPDFAVSQ